MDYTFLSENYVWIIVAAVIVVMTIIGYIADKTNFGEKKPKKETKTNNDTSTKTVIEQTSNEPIVNDYNEVESFDMPVVEQNVTFPEPEMVELVESGSYEENQIEPFVEIQPEVYEQTEPVQVESQFDSEQPIESFEQDTESVQELSSEDFEIPETVAENYFQDNIYDQDISVEDNNESEYVPFEEEQDFEEPQLVEKPQFDVAAPDMPVVNEKQEMLEPVQPEPIDFELPNIDKLNEEIAEVEEDEDVWKF